MLLGRNVLKSYEMIKKWAEMFYSNKTNKMLELMGEIHFSISQTDYFLHAVHTV